MDTHIYYRDIEVPIVTNLNVGDRLIYKGKSRRVTGFSYSRSFDPVFVDFGRYAVFADILLDENPHLQVSRYRTSAKDVKLYRQQGAQTIAGITLATDFYQFIYNLPNGVRYSLQPFTLYYVNDRNCYSDWTEWEIGNLPDPDEVKFTIENGIITRIC